MTKIFAACSYSAYKKAISLRPFSCTIISSDSTLLDISYNAKFRRSGNSFVIFLCSSSKINSLRNVSGHCKEMLFLVFNNYNSSFSPFLSTWHQSAKSPGSKKNTLPKQKKWGNEEETCEK